MGLYPDTGAEHAGDEFTYLASGEFTHPEQQMAIDSVALDTTDEPERAEPIGRTEPTGRTEKLLRALVRVAALLNKRLSVEKVIECLCEEAATVLGFSAASVRLYDPGSDTLRFAFGFGLDVGLFSLPSNVIQPLFKEDSVHVTPDLQALPENITSEHARRHNLRTIVMAAMRDEGRFEGILVLSQAVTIRTLQEDEVALLRGIADLGVQAIVSARRVRERDDAERSFHALIEELPDAIAVAGPHTGIRYANPASARLLGFDDPQELIDRKLYDFIHPDELGELQLRGEALQPGDKIPRQEIRLVRTDGRTIVADVVTIALDFAGAASVASIATDITERRAMQAQLASADRLSSLGTLAAGVAHEINNPLSYVLVNLEQAVTKVRQLQVRPSKVLGSALPAELEELLAQSIAGVQRIRRIVRDLKVFSRDDADAHEQVDINEVAESAMTLAWPEIRLHGTLERALTATCHVNGTDARIGQVVLNLLLNAAHAIGQSEATTATAQGQKPKTIRVGSWDDGDQVVLEVSDNGVGMDAVERAQIFDPFFTTKPVGVGTGLGLSISHGIVAALGGTIECQSERGVGTSMRVVLPAAAYLSSSSSHPPSSRVADEPQPKRRVLIVDDEPNVGKALVHLLEDDYDVTAATTGQSVVDRAKTGERWDAIVCDVMMPNMNGAEIYRQLQQIDLRLPKCMVFITGGTFQGVTRDFLRNVDNPCLDKPIDLDELRKAIAYAARTR